MAKTSLTDTIAAAPHIFAAMVTEQATDLSKLRRSGIVSGSAEWDARANGAGFETTVPSWAPLYLGAEADSADDSDTAIVPRKVNARNLVARRFHRTLAYQAADIVREQSGLQPLDFAASQLGRLWNDDQEKLMVSMLTSIEASDAGRTADSKFVKSLTRTSGTIDATNKLTLANMIASKALLGDAGDNITTYFIHSDIQVALEQAQANTFIPLSKTDTDVYKYGRFTLVVSDRAGKDTTNASYPVYTSYGFGPGIFGYGQGTGKAAVDRDEFKGKGWGQETIFSRTSMILHPMGFNCTATPANTVSLTNAEAAASGAYALVAERKAVPLVIVKTNG